MKYLIPLIILVLLIRHFMKKQKKAAARPVTRVQPEVLKQDPVCGAYVPQHAELSLTAGGEVTYFCSRACMEKFKELKRRN